MTAGAKKGRQMRYRSTDPGYVNGNGQIVVARTGFPSESRQGQIVYRMRCGACGFQYGSTGIDIAKRLCPRHQGGVKGELLREVSPQLFAL